MSAPRNGSRTPPEEKNLWRTPPALFAALDAAHGPFTLDVAADATNHLCPRWLGPGGLAEDALAAPWHLPDGPTVAFCNPPYGRGLIERFMRKAVEEAHLGHARTTFLVPANTDLPWWHELVWDTDAGLPRPGVALHFIKGRVRFLRPSGALADAPWFPSVVVTFGVREVALGAGATAGDSVRA